MKNNLAEKWMNSPNVSSKDKEIISKYNDQELATYFANDHLHFGTAGIRGKMGPGTCLMNKFTYQQYTIGLAKYIIKRFPKNPAVLIGHDNRMNSKEFTLVCANVLTSFGIKVYLFKNNHLTPTPIISYVIREMGLNGGIIITASHNPKQDNGFKVYNPNGGQILPEGAKEIEKGMPNSDEIIDIKIKTNSNLIRTIDEKYLNNYFLAATKVLIDRDIIEKPKTYPIVITTHHGTASPYLPKFLTQLKFNINPVKQQCFVDKNFKNSPSSNPEYFDSFNESIKLANKLKAKICLGVDPDADRMAVLVYHNNKWRLMTGNEMGIIYSYYLLNNRSYMNQPFIVSSYVSTGYIDRIAKKFDAHIFRTGTGFKWMGDCVSKNNGKMDFVVAFEEAIGALNTDINRDKDSFTASLLTLAINDWCIENKMDLVDYLEKVIFKEFGNWFGKTDSFIINDLNWKVKAIKLMDYFKHFDKKEIGTYKIKKISWNKIGNCLEWDLNDENWIKFRMSGTEPKFKVYYNLCDQPLAKLNSQYEKLHEIFKKIIEK